MRGAAIMTTTDAATEARETVYVAIELSKKTWVLGIAHPDRDRPSIHRVSGGNIAELVSRLRVAARNNRRILVCYEAGYDGFWLARALAKMGIECRVLDPASIQVNRRARRVKTDRIDVLALLRALIATDRGERHVCAIVRVPSVEEEDARRSHRERQRLVRERTGHINRIKGLLFAQGIRDMIEVAWLWQKYQPASPLSHWYIQRTAGQSSRIRRIMLIALARKLAISLWRYVETGLVPEGVAIAKAKLRPA